MPRHEIYGEDAEPDREECPRCGDSFLANHGDRQHCGKCSYTEWE